MDTVTVPQENRESCENHERYRHCMRGGPIYGENRSLAKAEKAIWELKIRESGELLRSLLHIICKYGFGSFFVVENRTAAPFGVAVFLFPLSMNARSVCMQH